jgi:hypothetical protein
LIFTIEHVEINLFVFGVLIEIMLLESFDVHLQVDAIVNFVRVDEDAKNLIALEDGDFLDFLHLGHDVERDVLNGDHAGSVFSSEIGDIFLEDLELRLIRRSENAETHDSFFEQIFEGDPVRNVEIVFSERGLAAL